MMRWVLLSAALASFGVALFLGGREPFGRLALALGAPSVAARLFEDAQWKAVATYRDDRFGDAAELFKNAGPKGFYNRGNALTRIGQYAAALEAYDAALAQNPDDAEASANYDLVAAFYAGTQVDPDAAVKWGEDKEGATVAASIARGSARASGIGDGVTNTGALMVLPEVQSTGEQRVRKVFDDKFMIASPRWLATLEDVPGAFLAERIAYEHKRRVKAGIAQEPEDEQ